MNIETLTLIITIAGIVFFLICLSIIIMGKKIDDPGAKQQRIKIGQYVEVSGNSIILLTVISAFLIIAPLGLYYWKRNYIPAEEVSENFIAKKDLKLELYIPLMLDNSRTADSVTVQVITVKGDDTTIVNEKGFHNNYYEFNRNIEPDVDYTLNFIRKGSPMNKFHYKFNKITSPMTLTQN
ncbi:MAG: hypothetical protein Q8M08_06875 [Bacteroidales bacterium]|nr:hypothetical protein [Bacteroidales bacterium]